MISLPRELKNLVEFINGTPRLKDGASEEQREAYDSFLARLSNATEITEDGASVVITNH